MVLYYVIKLFSFYLTSIKIEQLTKDWTDKWLNRKAIMEEYSVDINKKKAGVSIDSSLPHLMAMDDDILSTGVVLYHLRVRLVSSIWSSVSNINIGYNVIEYKGLLPH